MRYLGAIAAVVALVGPALASERIETCTAIARQASLSPASFKVVSVDAVDDASGASVTVVFDSANVFNAVIRTRALCTYIGKGPLPLVVILTNPVTREVLTSDQVSKLYRQHKAEKPPR